MRSSLRPSDRICSVMADLAEEVARFYGYDNIPTTLPSGEATTGKLSFKLRVEEIARDIAEFCGFSQGMTYSFESPKVFDKLLLAGGFTCFVRQLTFRIRWEKITASCEQHP